MKLTKIAAIALLGVMLAGIAQAAEEFTIRIKDHKFIPETTEVPSGEKVKLVIVNEDPSPEEFESYELNREKIIKGGSKGIVFIGPLEPGEYPFFGEFNMDSAKGKIIAK
ncbi:MAG TPA: cupredoxin domain-containing protein [Rhodospirillaceae bacterium]|nr:cupredoxin domain-containing protein [Rhodospirillaceae bacterium]